MKTKSLFLALSLPFAAGLSLAACDDDGGKNVCEQAGDIIVDDCGFDAGDGDGDGDSSCEGENEAIAQCVVDYPDQVCASIDDPLDTDAYADYADCVAAASGS